MYKYLFLRLIYLYDKIVRIMNSIDNKEIEKLWQMVYNLSIHMLHNKIDAEEATQSIFEKVIKNFSSFKSESKLSTWVYSIAYNYLLDMIKSQKRESIKLTNFEKDINFYKPYNNELNLNPIDEKIYIEEIKVGCTLALLQCLTPENRFIFILGNIFNINQGEAASICNLNYSTYRKRLSRSREKITNFMKSNCGLINPWAKCQCSKRILVAIEKGRLNRDKLLYQTDNVKIKSLINEMNSIDEIAKVYRDNPFFTPNKGISLIKEKFQIIKEIKL